MSWSCVFCKRWLPQAGLYVREGKEALCQILNLDISPWFVIIAENVRKTFHPGTTLHHIVANTYTIASTQFMMWHVDRSHSVGLLCVDTILTLASALSEYIGTAIKSSVFITAWTPFISLFFGAKFVWPQRPPVFLILISTANNWVSTTWSMPPLIES